MWDKICELFKVHKNEDIINYRIHENHVLIISSSKAITEVIDLLENNNYIILSEYLRLDNGDIGVIVKKAN